MGFETTGATCPHCNKQTIWSKVEPNSVGAFQFDACVACGFIEAETFEVRSRSETTKAFRLDTWVTLLSHQQANSMEELADKLSDVDPDATLAFHYEDTAAEKEYISSCVISIDEINKAIAASKA